MNKQKAIKLNREKELKTNDINYGIGISGLAREKPIHTTRSTTHSSAIQNVPRKDRHQLILNRAIRDEKKGKQARTYNIIHGACPDQVMILGIAIDL